MLAHNTGPGYLRRVTKIPRLEGYLPRAWVAGSVYRRRTRRTAQLAAQPSGRYRPGRNRSPALASSRVAGCRTVARAKSRAFAGFVRSRTRAARSLRARRATPRSDSDWAAATIMPRVSGKVTRRTARAILVSVGIGIIPRAGLDLDLSATVAGGALCPSSRATAGTRVIATAAPLLDQSAVSASPRLARVPRAPSRGAGRGRRGRDRVFAADDGSSCAARSPS